MTPSIQIRSTDRNASQPTIQCLFDGKSQGVMGRIRGPFCKYSKTLPSNYRIENGQSVVVDPCYWTPGLPFLYEVSLTCESESGTQHFAFQWGLRWCITHKNGLRVNGKPYVVRAICPSGDYKLSDIRELSASLFVQQYSFELCQAASEEGVMLICLGSSFDNALAEMQLHPAVHFSKHDGISDIVKLTQAEPAPHSVCMLEEANSDGGKNYSREHPQFVVRRGVQGDLADLRTECDRLQRDMAKFGQFAGYLIESQS